MAVSSGFDYEVFLSFRGPDNRAGITDFLYISMIDAGIRVYRDDEEPHVREEIGPELLQAIKQSRISIPIFSRRYASSKWCVKELVQMVECKKTMGQKVMPIFYDVEPSEVWYQTGENKQAFVEHESKMRYSDGTNSGRKTALSEVGALKGWDLHSMPNRHKVDFVKIVVKKVVGIPGMGGAGKTTLAKTIYNQLSTDFEHHCFLSNIPETSEVKGVEYLQNQLLFDILKRKWEDISNSDEGIEPIKERLCGKRLLLFLDDVDKKNQLNALMGHNWFGEGSKVVITSRNKEVFNVPEVDWTYEINCMDFDKSLQLFSKHAFRRDRPLDDYLAHSRKVVGIAGSLPLALEVIGSLLSCSRKEKWDTILKKLEKVPHEEVSSKLKISYEALDDRQKHIFLDIACFFIGYDKEIAIHLWDDSEFFAEEALVALQHMSLKKIDETNTLWMHDLIRDMGQEIIRQDSNMVTEKQTRVWNADQALDVLMTNQEKETVEAICLRFRHGAERRIADKDFMRLPNLRFLEVDGGFDLSWLLGIEDQKIDLEIMFESIMRDLRPNFHLPINFFRKKPHLLPKLGWLTWSNIPLHFDIAKLSMRNLAVLTLKWSPITHCWDDWSHIKMAKSLKVMDMSHCCNLEQTPVFSGLANLERLIMQGCVELVRVDKSISQLQRLVLLDVRFCSDLRDLPNEIYMLKSFEDLLIKGTPIEDSMNSSSSEDEESDEY